MSLCLTDKEILELTGKERPAAQARELAHLRIPHERRRDGSIIVYRVHLPGHMATIPSEGPRLHLVNGKTA